MLMTEGWGDGDRVLLLLHAVLITPAAGIGRLCAIYWSATSMHDPFFVPEESSARSAGSSIGIRMFDRIGNVLPVEPYQCAHRFQSIHIELKYTLVLEGGLSYAVRHFRG